jgi:excinuclease ABC subunit C
MTKSDNLFRKLQHLPDDPGVYLMKDAEGRIIYVGKARSLKNRVRSYFQESRSVSPKVDTLVSQVADLEYIVTDSELEALILEGTLIKKHKPKFNVILKDDKNFPYLKLTLQEEFPRVIAVRKIKKDGALYFGPYIPSNALWKTLKLIHKIFPIRQCTYSISFNCMERPCLDYQIGQCIGPCAAMCTKEEYDRLVQEVRLFLEGKKEDLVKSLQVKMEEKAANLEFEQAAKIRDQIKAIQKVMERQKVISMGFENQDILAYAVQGDLVNVQMFFIRNGVMVGRSDFNLTRSNESENAEILASFLKQFYAKEVFIPEEIVLPEPIGEEEILSEWLSRRKGKKVSLIVPQRGKKKRLVEMAFKNAELALREEMETGSGEGPEILERLQKSLGLRNLPVRIEAFDMSNIQGGYAVGSLVVWKDGKAARSEYKKFKVKYTPGPDDFGMMREVIRRRYSRVLKEGLELPDLIVIDGGKGQLSAALGVLEELRIRHPDVIGLAKAKGVKYSETDKEKIFLKPEGDPLILPRESRELQLLQRIRDEAHRFAVTYHRTVRKKATLHSILDEIPGIGPQRKKALLKHFGNIQKIREASVEELQEVPLMNRKLAETIRQFLTSTPPLPREGVRGSTPLSIEQWSEVKG